MTIFSNKLAKYNVSLTAYQERLKPEAAALPSETEDDDTMDATPSRADIFNAAFPPIPPPRVPIQTTPSSTTTTSSGSANFGFKSSPIISSKGVRFLSGDILNAFSLRNYRRLNVIPELF